ncbi:MAG: hypothetical protein [Microviridae sp.]|nr:MAG: hypothetical protein [Microviridae sp.]
MMGAGIADAAAAVADKFDQDDAAKSEIERLQSENTDLRRRVNTTTIRPDVPGIYAQPETVEFLGNTRVRRDRPPRPSPLSRPAEFLPVMESATGNYIQMDTREAGRLGLNAFDAYITEDQEALKGEVGGEVSGAMTTVRDGFGGPTRSMPRSRAISVQNPVRHFGPGPGPDVPRPSVPTFPSPGPDYVWENGEWRQKRSGDR